MAKHKVYKTNPLRKYIIISLFIFLFIGVGYSVLSTSLNLSGNVNVSKYDQTLYGVFEKNYKKDYAKLYTEEHQDSMDSSQSTKNIYYWNGTRYIDDKTNVIFGEQCWKMYRTTDTGGVKLLYNGEADDGKCLTTRSNHAGYSDMFVRSFDSSYYYGTSYVYDVSSNTFSLDGNITTGSVDVGLYTCLSTSSTGTCSRLYYVYKPSQNGNYETLTMQSTHYSQIGRVYYNERYYSHSQVGYMYNKEYNRTEWRYKDYDIVEYFYTTKAQNYTYYSEEISYDQTTNTYTLINPQLIQDITDYSILEGKFVSNTNNQSSNATLIVKYISSGSEYKTLKNGDQTTSLVYGSSYIDNGNGTYTIQNPTEISFVDYYKGGYSAVKKKYVCNGSNATCSNLRYVFGTYNYEYTYYSTEESSIIFGKDALFDNGVYTLTNTKTIWNTIDAEGKEAVKEYHYSCNNQSTSCEKIYYLYETEDTKNSFLELSNGDKIEDALINMFNNSSVNMYDSIIKKVVEDWYEKSLLSYDSYIEDTIFCNNRKIIELGGWNPNGGNPYLNYNRVVFYDGKLNKDLSCQNITDRFSTNNSLARLKYKIGLLTSTEQNLINNKNLFISNNSYWTLSPYSVTTTTDIRAVNQYGELSYGGISMNGVRPVISLKAGIKYTSGTGTDSDPYIVDTTP